MTFIKQRLLTALSKTDLLALYTLRKYGFLAQAGWFESWRAKRPIDAEGKPVPWMTYPCVSFLAPRVASWMEIFEFGCGSSTLWWADRVSKVVCCEHDSTWYAAMKSQVGPNVQLELRNLDQGYVSFIEQFPRQFHIIVVDGRDRVNCLKYSVSALTENGVLVLDDSERSQYLPGIEFLLQQGFRRLDFEGPGPIVPDCSTTTIFYRGQNCLNI